MKLSIINRIFPIAAIVAVLSGCEEMSDEKGEISIEDKYEEIAFENESGLEKTIKFTSEAEWTASIDAEWISVDPKSGMGGKNEHTLTITTLSQNPDKETRRAHLILSSENDTETITITQAGKAEVTPQPAENLITKITSEYTETENGIRRTVDYYFDYNSENKLSSVSRYVIETYTKDGEMFSYDVMFQKMGKITDGKAVVNMDFHCYDIDDSYSREQYDFTAEFDTNGNITKAPDFTSLSDEYWVVLDYNEDRTLAAWTFLSNDSANGPDRRKTEWKNGNMTFLEGMSGRVSFTDLSIENPGFDITFFLLSDWWTSPTLSYMGTPSANLPSQSEYWTYDYKFDENGRLTEIIADEGEGHKETLKCFYGKQEITDYPDLPGFPL